MDTNNPSLTLSDDGGAAPSQYRCACGIWSGERCLWTGPADGMVVVDFVGRINRDTASRLQSRRGLDARIAVERSCADRMLADPDDREWVRLVEGADPARYALDVDDVDGETSSEG